MTDLANQHILWVTRDDAATVPEAALRERAGVEDFAIDVHTEMLGKWGLAVIPAGSRGERGVKLPEVMSVGYGELPPEGRVYVIGSA